jgi:hypothetical protein
MADFCGFPSKFEAILREAVPILSANGVISNRKQRLIERVRYINDAYSG